MSSKHFTLFIFLIIIFTIKAQALELNKKIFKTTSSSSFSVALETLQKQIGYTFKNVGLLRRAMTHSSYSEENNKALSILGANVIQTSVSLRSLLEDIDVSAEDLNDKISEVSQVESSCAVDGMRLGLHKVIRVSSNTNSSLPSVVCGGYRAMFGAVAVDSGSADDAGSVYWHVHSGEFVGAMAL